MEKEINAVYQYYKSKYPMGVVLFHIGSHYEAYNEDAELLNRIAHHYGVLEDRVFYTRNDSTHEVFGLMTVCRDNYVAVHTISYVSKSGKLVLPKVNQIKEDMETDY